MATARCRTLSSKVGMPMGRICDPSPFGIWTRRTGGARYVPDFARSRSDWRFSSRFAAYSFAVCPSTPTAPSLRVRRYASFSQSMSMCWASVVNAIPGACLASFAIRSSFVQTVVEPDVSSIFPSSGSVSRHPLPSTGALGSVPPLRRYYGNARTPGHPSRLASFPSLGATTVRPLLSPLPPAWGATLQGRGLSRGSPSRSSVEMAGPPRFLGDLRAHAPLSDPDGTGTPSHYGVSMLPSAILEHVGSRHSLFRGSITRPPHSLSTLRSQGLPWTTQDSLPAGGWPWPDGSGYPQGPW